MTILGYYFKPKLWSIIVTAVFVFLFIQLGNWQLSRADEKNTRQYQLDQLSKQPLVTVPPSLINPDDFVYREVEAHGKYLSEHTIYIDNKIYKGLAGYHILTPLKLANSNMHVLINRGWVAIGSDRSVLPQVPIVEGEVVVTGLAVPPEQRTLALSDQVINGDVWVNFQLQRYEKMTGLAIQPIMVLQKNEADDGLVRDWERPDAGAERNIGYAIQWFSLAAAVLIIFLVLNVKRRNQEIK